MNAETDFRTAYRELQSGVPDHQTLINYEWAKELLFLNGYTGARIRSIQQETPTGENQKTGDITTGF